MEPQLRTAHLHRATSTDAPRTWVVGEVVPGDQRGRLLGFPTANLILPDGSDPADGVYAGYIHRTGPAGAGPVHQAAVSIGRRTTFYGHQGVRLLEAHLLDVDEDLYGETLRVELVASLRDQGTFAGPAALAQQLATDVSRCRDVLTVFRPGTG